MWAGVGWCTSRGLEGMRRRLEGLSCILVFPVVYCPIHVVVGTPRFLFSVGSLTLMNIASFMVL